MRRAFVFFLTLTAPAGAGGWPAPVPVDRLPPRGIVLLEDGHQLVFLDETGREVRRHVSLRAGAGQTTRLGPISPDGTRVLRRVWLKPVNGRTDHLVSAVIDPLTPDGASREIPLPPQAHQWPVADANWLWAADGDHLVGTSYLMAGPFGIDSHWLNVVCDLRTGRIEPLKLSPGKHGVPDPAIKPPFAAAEYFQSNQRIVDLSRDGRWWLACERLRTPHTTLAILGRDGTTVRPLAEKEVCVDGARFSPDGRRAIISVRGYPGGPTYLPVPSGLWLWDRDAQTAAPTTHLDLERDTDFAFAWRPDGRRIACQSRRPTVGPNPDGEDWFHVRLVTSDPDGRNVRVLTNAVGPHGEMSRRLLFDWR